MRIGTLLGNGPGLWLRMQQAVDIWELQGSGKYNKIEPVQIAV